MSSTLPSLRRLFAVGLFVTWAAAVAFPFVASGSDAGIFAAVGIIFIGWVVIAIDRPLLSLVVGIIGPLWILFSSISGGHPRWISEKNACSRKFSALGRAFAMYEHEHGQYPPAFVLDSEGRPMHSWRVLILPFMSRPRNHYSDHDGTYADVYSQYRFDEPWNSPHNAKLALLVDAFACPTVRQAKAMPRTATPYLAVVGDNTMWPGATSRRFEDVLRNAVLLIEAEPIDNWMEPKDISDEAAIEYLTGDRSVHRTLRTSSLWDNSRSLSRHVLMANGLMERVAVNQPREVVVASIDIADDDRGARLETGFIPERHDRLPIPERVVILGFLGMVTAPAFVPLARRVASLIGRLFSRRANPVEPSASST